MPTSTFKGRKEWEINDMCFRLEEIILYSRKYLLESTYPDEPQSEMKDRKKEEYKLMQREYQLSVSLCRDLMACVPIFKQIPVPPKPIES